MVLKELAVSYRPCPPHILSGNQYVHVEVGQQVDAHAAMQAHNPLLRTLYLSTTDLLQVDRAARESMTQSGRTEYT